MKLFLSAGALCLEAAEADNSTRGNPVCWKDGFTYAECCGHQVPATQYCWNNFFNYETCCLEPYKPTQRCYDATSAEEQLWHCRIRPHWRTQRCFQVNLVPEEKEMVETMYTGNYLEYEALQRAKALHEFDHQFMSQRAAEVIGVYLARHQHGAIAGLCHGAKRGAEVRLLRSALARQGRVPEILGTDIVLEAALESNGDVVKLDFHQREVDWLHRWDFVYSNTLDHSYNPLKALRTWRQQLRSETDSFLILQHSDLHQSCLESKFRNVSPMFVQCGFDKVQHRSTA